MINWAFALRVDAIALGCSTYPQSAVSGYCHLVGTCEIDTDEVRWSTPNERSTESSARGLPTLPSCRARSDHDFSCCDAQ
jgi:hypothetical protein